MSEADERNARVISDQNQKILDRLERLERLLLLDRFSGKALRLDVLEGRVGTAEGLLSAQGQMFAHAIPRGSGPTVRDDGDHD